MNTKTVQYKRTLRSSVGAGVSALFNGDGRRFFILNHRDNSKYHKAGESQKIIIDQIELGRDSNCQVRFDDENFKTVSRRHAAIVKDGERWKLVHLSTTNSTLVNGVPVTTEKYLENGDEIQLSIGGPRMGFIVPVGKQSLVSSIKMTERLELFRKQALRPYKNAIACLAVLLVLGGSFGTYKILDLDEQNKQLIADFDKYKKDTDSTMVANEKAMAEMQNKYTIALKKIKPEISTLIPKVENDVCRILVNYVATVNGKKYSLGACTGTAFLLNDGKLVTARHCVSERYNPTLAWNIEDAKATYGATVQKEVVVYTPKGDSFTISGDLFVVDDRYDVEVSYPRLKNGEPVFYNIKVAFPLNDTKIEQPLWGTDWAYAKLEGRKGSIVANYPLSKNLKAGTEVHMLGFPKDSGFEDGKQRVEAIYHKMSVSRDGLNDANCIMVSSGADHGNSGGPVFALVGNQLQVVGIVSRGDLKSEHYNHLVPLSNIKSK